MKKVVSILLIFIMIFCFCACAKVVSTQTNIVPVTIVNRFHSSSTVFPVIINNHVFMNVIPEKYCITVEFAAKEYEITGRETYEKFKDKIGETVNAKIETICFDDGIIKYNIVELLEV